MSVDGVQGLAKLQRCWWAVGGHERAQQPVVEFGVEDGEALAGWGEVVDVAAG